MGVNWTCFVAQSSCMQTCVVPFKLPKDLGESVFIQNIHILDHILWRGLYPPTAIVQHSLG